ncbi:MAG: B12-binding domain-containing radical SAM protein [Candidatus Lokiarchaeota archaeon]|nr:B12-binding domain-containing radical SAM protein [Candidatus Harpocratesius repetitus]
MLKNVIDVCLFNWKTELENQEKISTFNETAQFRNGILDKVNLFLREPPTGLLLLASILENHGYSVEIIDATLLEDPYLFIKENAKKFRLIGLTALTNTFPEIEEVIRLVKKTNPEIYIIVGGPHVSFEYSNVLNSLPEVDVVCIGEAENTFPWLVDLLLNRPMIDFLYENQRDQIEQYKNTQNHICSLFASLDYVLPGLAYRESKNNHTHIISTGFPPATNLDLLPLPARHLISRIYKVADILVNRGCPNQCSFCSRTRLFPKMRLRSLNSVIEEVDYVLSCGNYQFINFYDNINVKKTFFEQFLQQLIARPHMLPWGAELRSDVITLEQAKMMKQANCRVVATGIESASDMVLKTNFKFQNLKAVEKGIRNLKEAGIAIQAYFVIGLPGDTPSEFAKTLAFLESLPLRKGEDKVDFFVATPYPGCDLRMNPDKYGIKILNKPFTTYDCRQILITTQTLDVPQIELMIRQAEEIKQKLGL